jgi:hypothetical protein
VIVPRRASEFALTSDGEARLGALLAMEEFRVRSACGLLRLNSNACAIAFVYTQEHDLPLVTYTSLLTADAREKQRGAPEKDLFMWHPADWDHWHFYDESPEDLGEEPERLSADLLAAGCEDPEGAFLRDLARRLARADWAGVMAATDDFACYVVSEGDYAGSKEAFRETVSPEVVAAWEREGWLSPLTAAGLHDTLITHGASREQAQEISVTMLALFDFDEINEWLDAPNSGRWVEDDEGKPRHLPEDWTPRRALEAGHGDYVVRLARAEAGL